MDLVGTTEIAQIAGVNSAAVSNWKRRHSDFPEPLVTLASGPIWERDDIERWLAGRAAKEVKRIERKVARARKALLDAESELQLRRVVK